MLLLATLTWHDRSWAPRFALQLPILVITLVYLAVGVATMLAWYVTGDVVWVERFFRIPGAVLLVWLASVELWFSLRLWSHYKPGEPMRRVWFWITLSAAADIAGAASTQILRFRPMVLAVGRLLGGTVRYGLLAAGLLAALGVYRRARFLAKPKWTDVALLAVLGAYVVLEAWGVIAAAGRGRVFSTWQMIGWPVDPLLWLLLAEAMLLYRSAQGMGGGLVGRCWYGFAAGVALIALGDIGGLAESYGLLPYPWSSIVWFVWIPAACAFAFAPAYQLEAIQRASGDRPGAQSLNNLT